MNGKYNTGNWINWDIDAKTITPEELNDKLDELNIHSLLDNNKYGLAQKTYSMYDNSMCMVKEPHCSLFYVVEKEQNDIEIGGIKIKNTDFKPHIYRVSANNYDETNTNVNALRIYQHFLYLFKKQYKVPFKSAFGDKPETKNCVPKPINIGKASDYIYHHVYKADISSAYGYELSKDIPTSIGCIEKAGFYEPNNDYPFAFYPREGELSIYGEDIKAPIVNAEYTVLMKRSTYSFLPMINEIYEKKEAAKTEEERLMYKSILNISIGYFQKNTNPRYAYIAAVVKARCNKRVSDLMREIEDAGNDVILVNTDSVAWDGEDMPNIYTSEKKLGNFLLEHNDCKAYVRGSKCYQLLDKDGSLKTIWAGVKKEIQANLKFGDIFNKNIKPAGYLWDDIELRYKKTFLDECGLPIR